MINTYLTYDDLVEATTLMADRLLAAQDQVRDLNLKLAAAQGEVAALRGALEFEQDRARALRISHLPRVASASPLSFFSKLRSAFA